MKWLDETVKALFNMIPNLVKEFVKGLPSDDHQKLNLLADLLALITFIALVALVELPKEQNIYFILVAVMVLLMCYECVKRNYFKE
jgi:hypothetical protein